MDKTLTEKINNFGEKIQIIYVTFHGIALFFADKYWKFDWILINTLNTEHKNNIALWLEHILIIYT